MIGNDIIDRLAIRPRSVAHWERFREKTITRAEQEYLADYREKQLDIWLAWAIKEAVYKLEYQLKPERYFAPKAIQVLNLERAQGKWGTYAIDLEWNRDYIHALAWPLSTRRPYPKIARLHKEALNRQILSHLETRFPEREFGIEQQTFPSIKIDHKHTWPLSKSHHGRWWAFAYLSD